MDKYISDSLCGFCSGFDAQLTMIVMIEKMRRSLDKSGFTGMLMNDLSKAFDCMIHDLLIAKLEAYGLDYNALILIHNYLFERKHRIRVGIDFSTWSEIKIGVLQGSILGPTLFNIYINDIFLFNTCTDITNYADDNIILSSPQVRGINNI